MPKTETMSALTPTIQRHPFLADLLPIAADLARQQGHPMLADFHCFAVLLRDYAEDPIVASILGPVSLTRVEAIFGKMLPSNPPLSKSVDCIWPTLRWLLNAAEADAIAIGALQVDLLHVVCGILTVRGFFTPSILDGLGIDRKASLRQVMRYGVSDEKRAAVEAYYMKIHDEREATWDARPKFTYVDAPRHTHRGGMFNLN